MKKHFRLKVRKDSTHLLIDDGSRSEVADLIRELFDEMECLAVTGHRGEYFNLESELNMAEYIRGLSDCRQNK